MLSTAWDCRAAASASSTWWCSPRPGFTSSCPCPWRSRCSPPWWGCPACSPCSRRPAPWPRPAPSAASWRRCCSPPARAATCSCSPITRCSTRASWPSPGSRPGANSTWSALSAPSVSPPCGACSATGPNCSPPPSPSCSSSFFCTWPCPCFSPCASRSSCAAWSTGRSCSACPWSSPACRPRWCRSSVTAWPTAPWGWACSTPCSPGRSGTGRPGACGCWANAFSP